MAWGDFTNPDAWKSAMANLLRRGGEVTDYIQQAPSKAGQAILDAGQRQQALMNEAFDPTGKTLIRNPQAANQAAMNLLEGPLSVAPVGMTRADILKEAFDSANVYKALEEANKSTFPKIPVGNIFKNPQGKAPEAKIKSFDDVIEKQLELPLKEVDISAIVPTQKNINFDNLKKVKNISDAKDSILAVLHEGKYYLIDGHHRIANEILKNKDKINVRVFE